MIFFRQLGRPLGWKGSMSCLTITAVCFHLAYSFLHYPVAALFIFGYAAGVLRLTHQSTPRRAFYFGLTAGFLCVAPQLFFFWRIFSTAAVVLWLILAFWIGLFAASVCGCLRFWGARNAIWIAPIAWMGIEYFRSELYFLKFSWLNIGYAFSNFQVLPFGFFGMYGVGFIVMAIASVVVFLRPKVAGAVVLAGLAVAVFGVSREPAKEQTSKLCLVGVQLEFPPLAILPETLNFALKKNPDAQIIVLSEYTLEGGVPDLLKDWCRKHSRFLVVGGKDFVTNDIYYNTAFVVGTNGEIAFKQAKSVPIQFFKDGLPARRQSVWNSPWGKIGICICYDLSYTRVTDELVRRGAQLLIVPTMDVAEWGKHQHELHSRVAPVRAAEYHVPIFRLASSGISQAVTSSGRVVARTSIGGVEEILAAKLSLPGHGSLPLDRLLAPACVAGTGLILLALALTSWKKAAAPLMRECG